MEETAWSMAARSSPASEGTSISRLAPSPKEAGGVGGSGGGGGAGATSGAGAGTRAGGGESSSGTSPPYSSRM
eukprot:scaffold106542_cov48-Phaeocystis_antarctica.AAC.1